jgi:PAS domain S-box-containing protein
LPVLIVSSLLATNGTLAARLDYAFTQTWLVVLARAGELFTAALAAELIYILAPNIWGNQRQLAPSPAETSIMARFFYGTVPLVALLVLTLVVGDWLVAGSAAQRMLEDRLTSTGRVAASSLPYFLETGQNLILTMATPSLMDLPDRELEETLASRMRSVPYFRQLFLFDSDSQQVSGFPAGAFNQMNPTPEELMGINLAIKGVTTQAYVIPPMVGETSAQVSFLAAIRSDDEVIGVLLGRTDFNTNPFTQPSIEALAGMNEMGGEGMILSENGIILYHPSGSQVMSQYLGQRPEQASFFDDISSRNTRRYVYYQPVEGRPWAVVLAVPAQVAQQMALDIAIPLLVMLLVFSVLAFFFLRFGLRVVTSSLKVLAQEASYISMGQLDRPLEIKGVDEVGRLSAAFEQMRVSLKARLDELNRLLIVSKGIAANLDIGEAVRPILEAALAGGASAARFVLVHDVTLDTVENGPVSFGVGASAQLYARLDEQLFEIGRQQDLVNLPNVPRSRRLQVDSGDPLPGALLALAVRNENRYYGVFWVAYDKARSFPDEEIRFLSTLSGEAALAATSSRLYATAEIGRQRLEAVLASTPEPVLVIDEQNRLLLLNPAAMQVPGLILSPIEGQPVQDVIGAKEVIDLLTMPMNQRISSREITLMNTRVYYSSVASVMVEGRSVGRVCILRDVTHFKELEQLKSDFVSTVSHDLRAPLTLMRGYATMLQMVGELNDQQKSYVRKIVTGIENMTRLVTNLLDLGRIETGIGLQIEPTAVNEILDEVVTSLQLQAVQKDIRLFQEVSPQGKISVIEADRALLQQAIVNLVENAIKYTAVGGQVKIRLEARPNTVLFEVHDTGIGIAPLDLPHLFEKFYRSGRREAYQQRGTGLGLAIVRSIAERHGGRVWVDSQLGRGSVFSLEVPCEQPQKAQLPAD